MEHEHGGAVGWRAGVDAGAAGNVPGGGLAEAMGDVGGPLQKPPAAAVASAGWVARERAERLRTRLLDVRAARVRAALANALEAGGLEKLIEWLFALDARRLAGAVVDTLRDSGELPATLARLDAGELDAGAVVDRVAFGSLSRLYALADRALGPHSDGCGDD